MKRPGLFLRRASWLLAWGGSLAVSYLLGSQGGAHAAREEAGRMAAAKGTSVEGGPLSGKPSSALQGAGNGEKSGQSVQDGKGQTLAKTVDFKAKALAIEAMPPGPQRKEAW